MRRLLFAFLLLISLFSDAQVKITDMTTYLGNGDSAWVPVVIGNTNRKMYGRDLSKALTASLQAAIDGINEISDTLNLGGLLLYKNANSRFSFSAQLEVPAIWTAGITNSADFNNSQINPTVNGTLISRSVADDNPALRVNQGNNSSTGAIAKFQFAGIDKVVIDKDGNIIANGDTLGTGGVTDFGDLTGTSNVAMKNADNNFSASQSITGDVTATGSYGFSNATGGATQIELEGGGNDYFNFRHKGVNGLRIGWDGGTSGAGDTWILQGFGANRLSIQSLATITHISDNGRYEWEGPGSKNYVDFVGYQKASYFGRGILFRTETLSPVTPLAAMGYTTAADAFKIIGQDEKYISGFDALGRLKIGDSTNQPDHVLLRLNSTGGQGQIRFSNGPNYWDLGRDQDINGDFIIANSLGNRFKMTPFGVIQLPGYTAGFLKTDASGNVAVDNSTYAASTHTHAQSDITNLTTDLAGKQAQLNGTGLVRMSGTTPSYDNSSYVKRLFVNNTSASHTGNITETTVYSYTIPAGTMGLNSSLHIPFLLTWTNNANAKTFRIRINNQIVAQYGPTTNATGRFYFMISNRNSLSSQITGGASSQSTNLGFNAAITGGIGTYSFDFSQDQTITFTIQLGNSADAAAFEMLEGNLHP